MKKLEFNHENEKDVQSKRWIRVAAVIAITVLAVFFLILLFVFFTPHANSQEPPELRALPLYLRQGIAEVAQKYGPPEQFIAQIFYGVKNAKSVVYAVNSQFLWLLDNEGWVRQTYQPNRISGWEWTGTVNGRELTFFVPADGSFFFAIVGKLTPRPNKPIIIPPRIDKKQRDNSAVKTEPKIQAPVSEIKQVVVPEKISKQPETKYFRSGKTEEVPPFDEQ